MHSSVEADVVSVIIGEASYGELGFSEVTPYRVVLRGDQQIQVGDSSEDFAVEVGKFYTVAVLPDGLEVLEDKANENRAKALLSLYNLSDMESVDLKTADGSTDVIMGVHSFPLIGLAELIVDSLLSF